MEIKDVSFISIDAMDLQAKQTIIKQILRYDEELVDFNFDLLETTELLKLLRIVSSQKNPNTVLVKKRRSVRKLFRF